MKTLYAVMLLRSKNWDWSKPMRSQAQWDAHAELMDKLAAEGTIVLGGPLGDEKKVLLIFSAPDEAAIRSVLANDPWHVAGLLEIESIQPWTILLQAGVTA